MGKFQDLTGQKFGRLTVLRMILKNKRLYCQCQCECGNIKDVRSDSLKNGSIKSCGCINKKHGQRHTRLYKVWCSIKTRCFNKNDKSFQKYGAKGITMCKEWKEDFKSFYNWAMVNGYDKDAEYMQCTIDRINNKGNYQPDNCRWVNLITQANNKTSNHLIKYQGEVKTIAEWCRELHLNYDLVQQRITRYKWTPEKAFNS